jgi:hypothetical protein
MANTLPQLSLNQCCNLTRLRFHVTVMTAIDNDVLNPLNMIKGG